ncbi:hypothetical protein l13_10360 [Neisseria weaveri ATCC 51223]|nr:hypothetical protein l13_10360 [Neisseria weaveri ATCC 51223]
METRLSNKANRRRKRPRTTWKNPYKTGKFLINIKISYWKNFIKF